MLFHIFSKLTPRSSARGRQHLLNLLLSTKNTINSSNQCPLATCDDQNTRTFSRLLRLAKLFKPEMTKNISLMFQFLLPHTRGSSHGQTRIIRKAYEQDFYIPMMDQAYELWAQLEKEAGVKLYRWAATASQSAREEAWPFRDAREHPSMLGDVVTLLFSSGFNQCKTVKKKKIKLF